MRIAIKVVTKASRDRIVGWVGYALKVCVTAAPERGKANAAVVEVLAAFLGLKRSAVRIVSGETSARKVVEIEGVDEPEVKRRLEKSQLQNPKSQ